MSDIGEEFFRQLLVEIQQDVEREVQTHLQSARRVRAALERYEGAILSTVKARTLARVRRQPDPPSQIEDAASALLDALGTLPEFQTSGSPRKPEDHTNTYTRPQAAPSAPPPTPTAPPVEVETPPPSLQEPQQEPPEDEDGSLVVPSDKPPGQSLQERSGGSSVTGKRRRDARSPEVAPTSPYPHLAAHSEERPLHLCSGVPEPAKIEWFARMGIHARWERRQAASFAEIRGGRACAGIFMVGYGSHNSHQEFMQTCKAAGVPAWSITKMGIGELTKACAEINERLLKEEEKAG